MKAFNVFLKPFDAPQRSVKVKISFHFFPLLPGSGREGLLLSSRLIWPYEFYKFSLKDSSFWEKYLMELFPSFKFMVILSWFIRIYIRRITLISLKLNWKRTQIHPPCHTYLAQADTNKPRRKWFANIVNQQLSFWCAFYIC